MTSEKERHEKIAEAYELLEEIAAGEIEKGDPCIYVMNDGTRYPSHFGFIETHGMFKGWVRLAAKRRDDLVDLNTGVQNPKRMEKVIPLTPENVDESTDGDKDR